MSNMDLMYDHYKDTCQKQENSIKKRNRMFIIFCLLFITLFLLVSQENNIYLIMLAFIKSSYNLDVFLSIETIKALLWLIMFYVTLQYYSKTINIEREYVYIHNLEKKINQLCNDELITRENKFYLDKYPFILNFSDVFHKKVIPILFFISIVLCYTVSVINSNLLSFSNIIGFISVVSCSVLTITYIFSRIK